MSYVVEAYAAASDRLLWRSKAMRQQAAYDLAATVDADPRIEVRLVHVEEQDRVRTVVVVDEASVVSDDRTQESDPAHR